GHPLRRHPRNHDPHGRGPRAVRDPGRPRRARQPRAPDAAALRSRQPAHRAAERRDPQAAAARADEGQRPAVLMKGASRGWFQPPSPGDIVWCRFPKTKLPGPAPKPRPALVLRVGENDEPPVVEAAYGTGEKVGALDSDEFAIEPADRIAY